MNDISLEYPVYIVKTKASIFVYADDTFLYNIACILILSYHIILHKLPMLTKTVEMHEKRIMFYKRYCLVSRSISQESHVTLTLALPAIAVLSTVHTRPRCALVRSPSWPNGNIFGVEFRDASPESLGTLRLMDGARETPPPPRLTLGSCRLCVPLSACKSRSLARP